MIEPVELSLKEYAPDIAMLPLQPVSISKYPEYVYNQTKDPLEGVQYYSVPPILINYSKLFGNDVNLASGGFGDVKLVTSNINGRDYAIKFLKRPNLYELDREVSILRDFSNWPSCRPHIVCYHGAFILFLKDPITGQTSQRYIIITDYVEGINLFKLVYSRINAGNVLSVEQILDIYEQMMQGIYEIHNAGYAHRDIKPENIIVRPDGYVVIIDFGLGCSNSLSSIATCRDKRIVGTPNYLAPEAQFIEFAEQPNITLAWQKADIYSAGATLWNMLYYDKPPKTRIIRNEDPILNALTNLSLSMMSPNPVDRPSAEQILHILNSAEFITVLNQERLKKKR